MAACGFGRDWHKHWLFASSFSALSKLACACHHPAGSHQQIAGVRTESGHYLSRDAAEYPPELASQFAQLISPLLSTNDIEIDLVTCLDFFPKKGLYDPPFARQDGAGFPSQADWSGPHNFDDCFQSLRRNFFRQTWTSVWTSKSFVLCRNVGPTRHFQMTNCNHFGIFWMSTF